MAAKTAVIQYSAADNCRTIRLSLRRLRRDGDAAELVDHFWHDLQRLFHFGLAVEPAEGKTQAGTGAFVAQAHRLEHVRGVDGASGARTAAAATDVILIEQHEGAFTVDAFERKVGGVRQAVLAVAVHVGAFDVGEDAALEFVAHLFHHSLFVVHILAGDFTRLAEGDDAGDVLRAGAFAVFLSAADEIWRELGAAVDVEDADAFRTMELVAGEGE